MVPRSKYLIIVLASVALGSFGLGMIVDLAWKVWETDGVIVDHDQVVARLRNAAKAGETTWRIRWSSQGNNGLVIEEAWFTKAKSQPPIKVLGHTGLSNIFVPYASGSPRLWDLTSPRPGDGVNLVAASHVGPGERILVTVQSPHGINNAGAGVPDRLAMIDCSRKSRTDRFRNLSVSTTVRIRSVNRHPDSL